MHIFKSGLCVALLAASATAMANDKNDPPIGSCTITVPTMTPACINYMTRAACQERAQSSGGTVQWTENTMCPTPEQIMKGRSDLYPAQ